MFYTDKKDTPLQSPLVAFAFFTSWRVSLSLLLLLLFITSCQAEVPAAPPENATRSATDSQLLDARPDMTPIPAGTVPADALIATIPAVKPDRSSDPCGLLDDPLRQLYEADDPELFAQERGLWLTADGIGVEIRLASPETSLDLSRYYIAPRNQRGAIMEAFIPVEQLCNLAENEEVIRIAPLRLLQRP